MKTNTTKHMAVLFGFVMSVFLILATNVFAQEEQGFNKEEYKKEWQARKAYMYEKLGITEEVADRVRRRLGLPTEAEEKAQKKADAEKKSSEKPDK